MSGGSYNYLCYADEESLLQKESDIQDMANRLAGLGYANDAAKETEELILIIRQFKNRIKTRMERLYYVWRAVEWWDSADSDEDSVKKALKNYREENI